MATDTPITVEFAVAMTCSSCGERVTAALHAINGITQSLTHSLTNQPTSHSLIDSLTH